MQYHHVSNCEEFVFLAIAMSCAFCQELLLNYNATSLAGAGAGMCPDTQNLIETIRQGIDLLLDNNVLPVLKAGLENGACDCGGPGWRRVAYLSMSDPT